MSKGLKITTIGGGSSYTPELMEGMINRAGTLPVREWWLVDIEEGREKQEIVAALARRMVEKAGLQTKIYHTLDRRKALDGADFVTTQIRVGHLAAREKDESLPLSRGMLGQETLGAGGMFKAFRTIPVILDIAKEIKELSPNAWLINFTNPAGMVTDALIRYGGHPRFVGLCNGPIGMERMAAAHFGVAPGEVFMRIAGLNHLSYAISAHVRGECVMKELIEHVGGTSHLTPANIPSMQFDLGFLRQLGCVPISYLLYYYKREDMLNKALDSLKSGENRAAQVVELERQLFEIYKDENLDIKPPQLEKRGGAYYSEAACRLIESIHTDKRDIQPVVTKNNGAIADLPEDASVEVSSVITKDGPLPLCVGRLPAAVGGLVSLVKSFEILATEAAFEGNFEKAVTALAINPFSSSDFAARELVKEMMEAHKPYLGRFFKGNLY